MNTLVHEGLTFILPIANQASCLGAAIPAWLTVLGRLQRPVQVILINDGSTDDTPERLAQMEVSKAIAEFTEKPDQTVDILHFENAQGYGSCLREGISLAREPLIFYTGLESAYTPGEIRLLLDHQQKLETEYSIKIHLINGFRSYAKMPPLTRRIHQLKTVLLRLGLNYQPRDLPGWFGWKWYLSSMIYNQIFGVALGDVFSKFRLLRRELFDRIQLQSKSEFVHIEIAAKATFLECYMDEIPIAERPGPFPIQPYREALQVSFSQDRRQVFSYPQFRSPIKPNLLPEVVPESQENLSLPEQQNH